MAHLWKKLKRQGKVIADNQQVNVVANEEKLKWNKELSFILLLLKVNLNPTPILESKLVVMDDTFHIIGFKRV